MPAEPYAGKKVYGGNYSWRNFAPMLYLYIDDKPADDLLAVLTSFSYKASSTKAAETQFVFKNSSRRLMDDRRLYPNVTWKFRFGYFNDMSSIITAVIRNVEPEYNDKQMVTISLFDLSLQLAGKSTGKNWGKLTSSDIARRIARQAGMEAIVEDTKDGGKKDFIQPKSVSDLQFLRDLAADLDYEMYVDGSPPILYFVRKRFDSAPQRKLVYYDNPNEFSYVKEFKPTLKSLGPIQSGAASPTASAATDKSKDPSLGAKVPQFMVVKNAETGAAYVVPKKTDAITKAAPSGADTKSLVNAAHSQMLDKANEASSTHPLTPSLRVANIYEWDGVEKQLNGKWYLKEATYTIDGSGHGTTCTWSRNANNGQAGKNADNKNNKGVGGNPNGKPIIVANAETGSKTVILPGASK